MLVPEPTSVFDLRYESSPTGTGNLGAELAAVLTAVESNGHQHLGFPLGIIGTATIIGTFGAGRVLLSRQKHQHRYRWCLLDTGASGYCWCGFLFWGGGWGVIGEKGGRRGDKKTKSSHIRKNHVPDILCTSKIHKSTKRFPLVLKKINLMPKQLEYSRRPLTNREIPSPANIFIKERVYKNFQIS